MKQTGLIELENIFGLEIEFDNVVEKITSDWQIKTVTLLTRVGGIIGVGKELLWVIIFMFSAISIAFNYFK